MPLVGSLAEGELCAVVPDNTLYMRLNGSLIKVYPTDKPDQSKALIIESDFYSNVSPFAPGLVGTAISTGSASMAFGEPNHPGVLQLLDSTTANGGYRIMTDVFAFLLSGGEKLVGILKRVDGRTTTQFRIGFFDSINSTLPVDGCYLQYDGATGLISAICRSNNTQTVAGTTFAFGVNNWYTSVIELNEDATSVGFALYSEGGALVWQENVSTNIPNTIGRQLGAGVLVYETSTSASAAMIHLDYLRIEINRNLVR